MYFGEALRVLVRRWYVLLAGLLLLVGAAGLVVKYVPTQYQASGQLLLVLPAQASGVETPTNPYLNLQDGLSTTASLIASAAMTKDTDRSLAAKGFKADYSAGVLPGSGPIIVVTTKSSNPENALATRDEVLRRLDARLKSLQTEVVVPTAQIITALPFNVDSRAEVLPGNKIRALIAVGAGLMVFTLIAAFVLDGWRRKRRTDPDQAKGSDSDDQDAPLDASQNDDVPSPMLISAGSRPNGVAARGSRRAKERRRRSRGIAQAGASAGSGARQPSGTSRPGNANDH